MNLPLFIAYRQNRSIKQSQSRVSPIVKLSVACITVSVAAMLITVAVLLGFKHQISEKVIGFLSDVSIVNYDGNTSFETQPINGELPYLKAVKELPEVKHSQPYILKPSIISTDSVMEGVVLKGVDENYDWNFFSKNIEEGTIPKIVSQKPSNQILISRQLADRIQVKNGDKLSFYFIQNPMRVRRLEIVGIYNTQLEEFDKMYAFCDIKHLRKLNDWDSTQISGYEVYLSDPSKNETAVETIENFILSNKPIEDQSLKVESVKIRYQSIFDWLALQDMNAIVIIVLMAFVAGFNMIAGQLVLLFYQISSIGVLKTVGASNQFIRKIYICQSGLITIKGLLYGNLLAIVLCVTQYYFKWAKLNPETYYLDHIPVEFNLWLWLGINFFALLFILLLTILPSFIIHKISPSEIVKIT